jgi:hypothetical protein
MKTRERRAGSEVERRGRLLPAILALISGAVGCGTSTPVVDVCRSVTCSGHGHCVSDGTGPRCACDPGYSPVDLECRAGGGDADGDGDEEGDGSEADAEDGDADAPVGLALQAAGITTIGGVVLQTSALRVTDMSFEGSARLCAGALCVEGGVVP